MNKVSRFAVTTAFSSPARRGAYAVAYRLGFPVRIAGSDFPAIQAVSGAAPPVMAAGSA
ncbi:MAG: hypothetical protein CM15mP115_04550 [Alphaproteobacteria bacterium]|nr:MAG: hypothetical protein CM15mP115_04550 [Alphaproteobacteria bacterium]